MRSFKCVCVCVYFCVSGEQLNAYCMQWMLSQKYLNVRIESIDAANSFAFKLDLCHRSVVVSDISSSFFENLSSYSKRNKHPIVHSTSCHFVVWAKYADYIIGCCCPFNMYNNTILERAAYHESILSLWLDIVFTWPELLVNERQLARDIYTMQRAARIACMYMLKPVRLGTFRARIYRMIFPFSGGHQNMARAQHTHATTIARASDANEMGTNKTRENAEQPENVPSETCVTFRLRFKCFDEISISVIN